MLLSILLKKRMVLGAALLDLRLTKAPSINQISLGTGCENCVDAGDIGTLAGSGRWRTAMRTHSS